MTEALSEKAAGVSDGPGGAREQGAAAEPVAVGTPNKTLVGPVDPRERVYRDFSDEELASEGRRYAWWLREYDAGALELDARERDYLAAHVEAIAEEQARRRHFKLRNPERLAPGLSREFLDQIKGRFDLVGAIEHDWAKLRKSGKTYHGPCPFHNSRNGDSFYVYPGPDDPHFHCFNCGVHGDAFTWVRNFHNVNSFREAVARAAALVGLAMPERERERDLPARAASPRVPAVHQGSDTARGRLGQADRGGHGAASPTPAPDSRSAPPASAANPGPGTGTGKDMPMDPLARKAGTRLTQFTAAELLALELPEPRWAVPGLLPEGLTLLAGRPKLGKSWLALSLALAVASGGRALGSLPVVGGPALYLALEDGTKRLQARLSAMLHGAKPPEALTLWTACPRLDQGGLNAVIEWIYFQRSPRLIVIDTLKRIRARATGGRPLYDEDYEALLPLATLAQTVGIAVVVVHHTRKAEAEDPLDLISGSTGLTGAADGAWILTRNRGSAEAVLKVVHRDVPEAEHALRWDGLTRQWIRTGDARESAPARSPERQQVLDLLASAPEPLTPKEIAERLGRNQNTTRVILMRMAKDGDVTGEGGRYRRSMPDAPRQQPLLMDAPMPGTSVNTVNAVNAVNAVNGIKGRDAEVNASINAHFPNVDAENEATVYGVYSVYPDAPPPTATPDADPPPICWACGEALPSEAERARGTCDRCEFKR